MPATEQEWLAVQSTAVYQKDIERQIWRLMYIRYKKRGKRDDTEDPG